MSSDNNKRQWIVTQDRAGKRLDVCLAHAYPDISRSQWKRLITTGMVKIRGYASSPGYIIKSGDTVDITIPEPEPLDLTPESFSLDILFEDDTLLVVNKPAGIVVHPGAGHSTHTLVHGLLHHCEDLKGIGGKQRPGIVHRLDKDTSGLLMVAKTEQAHRALSLQLKDKSARRTYIALVHGVFTVDEGEIKTLIGRHPRLRQKMSIYTREGREAVTHWRIRERFSSFTLMELQLRTGRTHQIRVHMSHIHHPVVGDRTYGRNRISNRYSEQLRSAIDALPGQALHAETIGFIHPSTAEYMEFSAPPPPVIMKILDILRQGL